MPRARAFAEVGGWICAQGAGQDLLGGVFQDIGLYCALARHDPDGTAADWRTWWVGDRTPGRSGWQEVHAGAGGMRVWRLAPERDPRPCAQARPAAGSPHLAVAAAHAELVGEGPDCAPPER